MHTHTHTHASSQDSPGEDFILHVVLGLHQSLPWPLSEGITLILSLICRLAGSVRRGPGFWPLESTPQWGGRPPTILPLILPPEFTDERKRANSSSLDQVLLTHQAPCGPRGATSPGPPQGLPCLSPALFSCPRVWLASLLLTSPWRSGFRTAFLSVSPADSVWMLESG